MAKIYYVVKMRAGDSIPEFKHRCMLAMDLAEKSPAFQSSGHFAVGRSTASEEGLHFDMKWGIAHDEMPSQQCVIASYAIDEVAQRFHSFDRQELISALVNPTDGDDLSYELFHKINADGHHLSLNAVFGMIANWEKIRSENLPLLREIKGLPPEENRATTKIFDEVISVFDDGGLSSIGANAALKAMAKHWDGHITEGRRIGVLRKDAELMHNRLNMMITEIYKRVVASEKQSVDTSQSIRQDLETLGVAICCDIADELDSHWYSHVCESGMSDDQFMTELTEKIVGLEESPISRYRGVIDSRNSRKAREESQRSSFEQPRG